MARKYSVGRDTVRQALRSAEPATSKTPARVAPKLDGVRVLIDAMLRQDLDVPRKQRQTATRIHHRLLDEHGADVSYAVVRDYVRNRRAEIDIESGRGPDVFISQLHAAEAEAEVDVGEVWVILAGVKTKCHMFTFRLSRSGKAIHRVYSTPSQVDIRTPVEVETAYYADLESASPAPAGQGSR